MEVDFGGGGRAGFERNDRVGVVVFGGGGRGGVGFEGAEVLTGLLTSEGNV